MRSPRDNRETGLAGVLPHTKMENHHRTEALGALRSFNRMEAQTAGLKTDKVSETLTVSQLGPGA